MTAALLSIHRLTMQAFWVVRSLLPDRDEGLGALLRRVQI